MSRTESSEEITLVCNTGVCQGKIQVTSSAQSLITVGAEGTHSHRLEAKDSPPCPRCGQTDSGFVSIGAAKFANELSRRFRF